MSKPGKLNEILGDFETTPDNPLLDWDQAGPAIQKAIQAEKRRRRRLLIWWFSGLGVILMALFSFFQANQTLSNKHASAALNSEVSSTTVTTITQELSQSDTNLTPNKSPEKEGLLFISDESSARETKFDTYDENALVKNKAESTRYSIEQNRIRLLPTVEPRTQADIYNSTRLDRATNAKPFAKQEVFSDERSDNSPLNSMPKVEKLDSLFAIPLLGMRLFDLHPPSLAAPPIENKVNVKSKSPKKIYLLAGMGTHNLGDALDFSDDPSSTTVEMGIVFMPFQNRALRNIELSAGIQYRSDRITTAFTNSRPVQLYRPGTLDTVIRYSIGEETRITRDSIPGIATRIFRNTASFNQWSVPLHVGHGFSAGFFRLTPEAGIMATLIQQRSGRISDANFLITDIQQNSSIDLQLAYRLGLRLGVPVGEGQVIMRYIFSHTPRFQVSNDITHSMNRQVLSLGFQYPF